MSSDDLSALELFNRVLYGRLATSMRAMPFLAPARHLLVKDSILLRMHAGSGYHRACNGSVVAYGADNYNSEETDLWSVQCTGTAEIIEPTSGELQLFGVGPHHVDGVPLDPVYMCVIPQFVIAHTADYS